MLITAVERGLLCFGDEDDAELPTSAMFAYAELDSELVAMLSWDAAHLISLRVIVAG